MGLYIIQKLQIMPLLLQITPTLCNTKCVKGGIFGNNSNIRQKNDLYIPDISLRNTIRKPSLRVHPQE